MPCRKYKVWEIISWREIISYNKEQKHYNCKCILCWKITSLGSYTLWNTNCRCSDVWREKRIKNRVGEIIGNKIILWYFRNKQWIIRWEVKCRLCWAITNSQYGKIINRLCLSCIVNKSKADKIWKTILWKIVIGKESWKYILKCINCWKITKYWSNIKKCYCNRDFPTSYKKLL